MTSATAPRTQPESTPKRRQRTWQPHIWQGCNFQAWLRLLWHGRFAIHPSLSYVALIATLVSMFHSVARLVMILFYGRAIARTPIEQAPLFIIGHWRTGTTWLHELLILDERHAYPSTYECFDPNHFLLTENFFKRFMRFLVPSHRPMDNMSAGWERPQEDEFALCMLGLPSPYLTIAFPNRPPQFPEYLTLADVPERALDKWKRTFLHFLKALTYKWGRRLVLKSPPHSCRIKVLLDMFPRAQFVHIMRDPFVVFPSTTHMWMALYQKHGLQKPTGAGLEEHVYETFTRLYDALEAGKKLIPPGQFHELRYEDLVLDPEGQLQVLYEKLNLGGYEKMLPRLRAFLAESSRYETNRYQLSEAKRQEIARRWGSVIERYGYERQLSTRS